MNAQSISKSIDSIVLEDDAMVVSFDVMSLYTNVPVNEAIDICSDFCILATGVLL